MASPDRPVRIFLWIVPRVNSTVFAKCMSFVEDTEVWMEPFMACLKNDTKWNPDYKKGDPMVEKMKARMTEYEGSERYIAFKKEEARVAASCPNLWPQDKFKYPWVKEQLEVDSPGKKFVLIKDMSSAINGHLEYLPDVPTRHTFLIRHPGAMYPSYKNLIANWFGFATIPWDDCHAGNDAPMWSVKDFFKTQHQLWKDLRERGGPEPIVIDGHDLASRPEVILPKYFEALGIPYKESYLKWDADDEFVNKNWRGSTYSVLMAPKSAATKRAVGSASFEPPRYPRGKSNPEWKLTPELVEFIEDALPYYEEMFASRLQ